MGVYKMYRVMAADDEPMMRKGLQILVDWAALGCELVAVAEDGQALLEAIGRACPDIVICDIKMPRKDGIEVARIIRERRLPIQIILLTAYADFSYARQAIQYQVSDYVTKNGAMDGIVAAIEKCIGRIEEERAAAIPRGNEIEGYFRAVLDTSLCERREILDQAAALKLRLESFILLAAEFCLGPAAGDGDAARLTAGAKALLAEGRPDCYIASLGRGVFCAVLPDADPESAELVAQSLSHTLLELAGAELYIGLSGQLHTPMELTKGLSQARRALDLRFWAEGSYVFPWREAERRTARTPPSIGQDMDRVAAAVAIGDRPTALALLEGLFSSQRGASLSPSEARGEGRTLLNLIAKQLALAREPTGGLGASDLEDAILACQSFEDLQRLLTDIVDEGCRHICDSQPDGSGVINEAQHYIHENYQRSVTLTEIASAVRVNPSYLSRIFKQKTGVSIVDTVNRLRVEKAKELLSTGQYRVYEVAAAVGIEDAAYFGRLFHRLTGFTPKAYSECVHSSK